MTKANNAFQAFDMSKFIVDFDPSKFTAEFAKMGKDFKFPTVDIEAVVETQQKNIDALTAANKAVGESVKALAVRQGEILQENATAAQKAFDALAKSKTPQDAASQQIEFVKGAYEMAFANMRELTDMVTASNKEGLDKLNTRFAEGVEEAQALAAKLKN